MTIDISKLAEVHGYREGGAEAADPADAATAVGYKKDVARNYINISADQIDAQLGGTEFFVTRKLDGEMNVLFFDGQQAVIINRSGRIRAGLPCVEDAKASLVAAGVTQAVIPVELYVDEAAGRTRVFHVLAALADPARLSTLRLAGFDLLEIDGQPFKPNSYAETHAKLAEVFAGARLCGAVEGRGCQSKADVKQVYADWVEEGGAEGLVVRTELPLVYKVKPRHTIDVVVVGYSEGSGDQRGQVRTLLLAMMPAPGEYQVIGRTGNGFTDDAKADLLKRLEALVVESQYIETDSNRVAFRMIRPEVVIELMVNDVLFDTPTGDIDNPVLSFADGVWRHQGTVAGISVVYPIFVRFRDDKRAEFDDVRLAQINEFAYAPPPKAVDGQAGLAPSELLRREVFTKQFGAKLMVQKFLVWKTNKPAPGWPAYVFHYTNFSSDRKDPLQRDVAVSDDESQIMEICQSSIEANVKKGWVAVE